MIELSDYSDEIGRVDVAARTSDWRVTVREPRSDANDANDHVLEIVVTNDNGTECKSIQITPDQFGLVSVEIGEEVSDQQ